MKYYLKMCAKQELGSIKEDGKPNRGRYIYISKCQDINAMFPPLSRTELNDSAVIPVIPLYSGEKVYCNYIYHNDKYHGSTAKSPCDEFRLYLNNALEQNKLLFQKGDIAVFRTEEFMTDEDEKQTVYLMDLVKKDESPENYLFLKQTINLHSAVGGHGIYEGKLSFFESRAKEFLAGIKKNTVIDNSVTTRIAGTDTNRVAELFNSSSFRDFVMVGYDYLCAITGTVIKYDSFMNLEAAHIKPRSRGGLYLPSNGIALSRDLHWAFDKGFFTLTDDYKVKVHPKTTSDYLRSFDGKQIRIPSNPFFRPDIECIQYHRNSIYGLFLTTGRL